MTNEKSCLVPATGSVCLQKLDFLVFTERQIHQVRAAGEAYRRLFAIRGTAPEWAPAHSAWQEAAEALAIALVKHVEQLEAFDDRNER